MQAFDPLFLLNLGKCHCLIKVVFAWRLPNTDEKVLADLRESRSAQL